MNTNSDESGLRKNGNDPAAESGPPPRKRGGGIIFLAVLALMGLGVWRIYKHFHPSLEATAGGGAGAAGAGGPAKNFPVPVVEGIVVMKDVPVYLDGLGTVQGFNTVTVHSRVDGQLLKVLFTEGQDVHAGDVLAELDPAPFQASLDQATARKAQDEVALANARVDLERYANLLKTEGVTQQIYDTQKALVSQLEASIKSDQAAIDSTKVQLDYTTIRSPIDGRVGIRQVDAGNIVHANDANGIVVVTQLKPISVLFTLPEQSLSKLQREAADFTVLAVGRDNTNVLAEGKLAVIDNQIDTSTGTIKLKATFPNETLRLWPGQFINTRLLLSTRKDGLVVPASVVQRGPAGAFAYVINEDLSVEMRAVKVAQIESGLALIDDGLKAGERVVVDGQYKLQPGSKVKPIEPQQPGSAPDGASPKSGWSGKRKSADGASTNAPGSDPPRTHEHKKPAAEN